MTALSSKQAFYAGMATGAGLMGSLWGGTAAWGRARRRALWARPRVELSSAKATNGQLKKLDLPPKADAVKKLQMPPKPVKPIPVLKPVSAATLSTTLAKGPVSVRTTTGPFVTNGYRVLDQNGAPTGLAVTPAVGQDEQGRNTENRTAWGLTHVPTGALISAGFESPEAAQVLAGKLAHLRWTEPSVPPEDVAQARRLVQQAMTSTGSPVAPG